MGQQSSAAPSKSMMPPERLQSGESVNWILAPMVKYHFPTRGQFQKMFCALCQSFAPQKALQKLGTEPEEFGNPVPTFNLNLNLKFAVDSALASASTLMK